MSERRIEWHRRGERYVGTVTYWREVTLDSGPLTAHQEKRELERRAMSDIAKQALADRKYWKDSEQVG